MNPDILKLIELLLVNPDQFAKIVDLVDRIVKLIEGARK